MSSRVHPLTLFCTAITTSVLWAGEAAPSLPSRVALYQRDVVSRSTPPGPNAAAAEESLAALRHMLARQAARAAAEPPTLSALRPLWREGAASRFTASRPPQTSPLLVPTPRPPQTQSSAERELALQPTSFTPYDRYLGVVRNVIGDVRDGDASVGTACRLMMQAHAFRYIAQDPYRASPPAVTASRRAGDCKSKALWLYDRLGDPSALYVIGKLSKRAKSSHAWLYWRYQSRWWILDPTNRSSPVAADTVSSGRYVPYYSLGKNGTYRHAATQLLLASESPAAKTPPVSSRSGKKRRGRR